MPNRVTIEPDSLQETLLIPLYFRAVESQRPDAILSDANALSIVSQIDFDFSRFQHAWRMQLDVSIRSKIIDEQVRLFLQTDPEALIVNLGAGLDGGFERIDNGRLHWFDLDLPDVINIRKDFYQESSRRRFISGSVFEDQCLNDISLRPETKLLFIAEGLLMYFNEAQVRSLLTSLADRFPGAEFLLHSTSPFYVGRSRFVPSLSSLKAELLWGCNSGKSVCQWDSRFQFLGEWSMFDQFPHRWGWANRICRLIPPVYSHIRDSMKITHIRLGESLSQEY